MFAVFVYSSGFSDARLLGPYISNGSNAFEQDLCSGTSDAELAVRHDQALYYVESELKPATVAEGLTRLRQHHIGKFGC